MIECIEVYIKIKAVIDMNELKVVGVQEFMGKELPIIECVSK